MSFPEKKFKEWAKDKTPSNYRADLAAARWGYEERIKEDWEAIKKTRSSKSFDLKCSKAYNVGFENGFKEAKRQTKKGELEK